MWLDTLKKTWVSKNFGRISKSRKHQSRSLVFATFVFTFFESRNFLPKSLGVRIVYIYIYNQAQDHCFFVLRFSIISLRMFH